MSEESSDSDEGFATPANKIKIEISEALDLQKLTKQQRPIDFQARYIFGDGLLRKQPAQIYKRFERCHQTQIRDSEQIIGGQKVVEPQPPYKKYMGNSRYSLVYSRNKDVPTFPNNDDFTMNQMSLTKILNGYDPDHYSLLRPFELKPQTERNTTQLEFDSRFQGGNLLYAFKDLNIPNCYSLFLQNDTNSLGYNQWFYFSIKNAQPGVTYQFSIVNLRKRWSFFSKGMKISVFSLVQSKNREGPVWRKMGNNIKYSRSPICKQSDPKFKFYSLKFDIEFLHQNDLVYLAMNIPYSYSRLIHHLKICENQASKTQDVKWNLQPIAHSICNNAVPYLTIYSSQQPSSRIIIIMARQHPGQTWSSYLMEEILYLLISPTFRQLLSMYTFKIFPMINVDGVIYGNFRCDVAGFDMNRTWKNTTKNLLPQVFSIKEEITKLSFNNKIQCVLDLHGHSKQYNSFCYSCKDDPIKCRILPYIISTISQIFTFKDCTFGISKYKQSTARAVIYNIINNENVLTIQNSFYGYKNDKEKFEIFQPGVMKELSEAILKGLQIFLKKEGFETYEKMVKQSMASYWKQKKVCGDSGSDSDPSADQISLKEKIIKILPRSFATILEKEEDISATKKKKQKKISISKGKKDVQRKFQTIVPGKHTKKQVQTQQKEQVIRTFINKTNLNKYKTSIRQGSVRQGRPGTNNTSMSIASDTNQSLDHYNRKTRTIISKTNEVILPFYIKEKTNLVSLKLKNNTEQVIKEFSKGKEKQRNQQKLDWKFDRDHSFRKSYLKENSKKRIKIQPESDEEFPLLCVFSEERRKQQNGRKDKESPAIHEMPFRNETKRQFGTVDRYSSFKKMGRQRSLQERGTGNSTLAAQIWRETFNKYGAEIERGVLMGRNRKK